MHVCIFLEVFHLKQLQNVLLERLFFCGIFLFLLARSLDLPPPLPFLGTGVPPYQSYIFSPASPYFRSIDLIPITFFFFTRVGFFSPFSHMEGKLILSFLGFLLFLKVSQVERPQLLFAGWVALLRRQRVGLPPLGLQAQVVGLRGGKNHVDKTPHLTNIF